MSTTSRQATGKPKTEKNAIAKAQPTTSLACSDGIEKATHIVGFLDAIAAIDRREVTDGMRDLYVMTICNHKPEFSLRQIRKGLDTFLQEGSKWPWPGELIDYIEEEV